MGMHVLCGIVGAYLAFAVVGIILRSVSSGVVAIFVCFAEDPAAGKNNRPEDYQRLVTRMSIYWKRHELRDWSRNLWWLMERSKPRRDSLSRCRHKPKWCMCKLNHNRCRAKLRWFMSKGNHQYSNRHHSEER